MKKLSVLGNIFLAFICISCTSLDYNQLDISSLKPATNGLRLNVPHISQNDNYSCGITSIAMALSFYENKIDAPLDKDIAWKISKSNITFALTKGFDLDGFNNLVSFYGYKATFVNNLGIERLKILLSNGVLVVLLIQPIKGSVNTHAVLAVGYNDFTGSMLVEDPAGFKKAYGYKELNDFWKAEIGNPKMNTVNAGFVIYPKNK